MRINILLAALTCWLFSSMAAEAQNMAVFSKMKEKKIRRTTRLMKAHNHPKEDGSGRKPYLAKLDDVPKRVGLISFYIFDPNNRGYQYTDEVDGKIQNHVAARLMKNGFPGLKEAFAAEGMDVLLPEEYLDSPEKKAYYASFEVPEKDESREMRKEVNYMKNNPTEAATPASTIFLPTHSGLKDDGVERALNGLLVELELDALLIVGQEVLTDSRNMILEYIELMMFGPNPIPRPAELAEDDYLPCMVYGAGIIEFKKSLVLSEFHKHTIQAEDYKGYDRILKVVASELVADVVGDIKSE